MNAALHTHAAVTLDGFALDVRFAAAEGEVTVVVGPNGAGKSTLLRTIAGLVPLEHGRIELDGIALDDPDGGVFVPPHERSIGMVFQDGLLFPHLDARDNVAFGLRTRGTRKAEARRVAEELLDRMGLGDHVRSAPLSLSGGQAQRVALARAIAFAPRVLLLDEPLVALDATTRIEVRHVLRDHLASFAGVRLLVTHDPVEALTLADRVIVLEHGRVVQTGTPDDIRRRPATAHVARLLGVNLLTGTARGGELHLANRFVLHCAPDAPLAGACVAVVEPSDVMLSDRQPYASARNTWRTTVVDLDHEPGRVRVRVGEPVPLVADVTAPTVAELGLRPGAEVWCAVKATAIDLRPA